MTSDEDRHKALLELVRSAPPLPLIKRIAQDPERIGQPRLRDFIFSFSTLEFQLRLLTATVLAEVLSAIALIAARDRLVPVLAVNLGRDNFSIPWPSYAIAGLTVIAGICVLTRGTLEAAPRGRLYFAGMLSAFFLAAAMFTAPTGQIEIIAASFGAIAYCAFSGAAGRFLKTRYAGSPRRKHALGWAVLLVATAPALYLLFGQPPWFTISMVMLVLPLVYIFMLAGTDWAEMVNATALWALNAAVGKWRAIWLALLGIAFCAFFAQFMKVMSLGAAWTYVLPTLLPVLPMFLLLRFARTDTWENHMSWGGLAIATGVYGICSAATFRLGTKPSALSIFWPLLYAIAAAALLLLCARRPKLLHFCPVLLFAVILGLLATDLKIAGPPTIQWAPLDGLMQGIALGSIYGIFYLLYFGWMNHKDVRVPIFYVVLLNVGCFSLYLLSVGLYASLRRAGDGKALIEAGVLFIAICWDVLLSGHSITNVEGKMFPRRSRIFLFMGYVLLVAATVLFWNTVQVGPGDFHDYVDMARDPDFLVQLGIALFGPAILLTLFALYIAGWVRSLDPEDDPGVLVRRLEALPFQSTESPRRH